MGGSGREPSTSHIPCKDPAKGPMLYEVRASAWHSCCCNGAAPMRFVLVTCLEGTDAHRHASVCDRSLRTAASSKYRRGTAGAASRAAPPHELPCRRRGVNVVYCLRRRELRSVETHWHRDKTANEVPSQASSPQITSPPMTNATAAPFSAAGGQAAQIEKRHRVLPRWLPLPPGPIRARYQEHRRRACRRRCRRAPVLLSAN